MASLADMLPIGLMPLSASEGNESHAAGLLCGRLVKSEGPRGEKSEPSAPPTVGKSSRGPPIGSKAAATPLRRGKGSGMRSFIHNQDVLVAAMFSSALLRAGDPAKLVLRPGDSVDGGSGGGNGLNDGSDPGGGASFFFIGGDMADGCASFRLRHSCGKPDGLCAVLAGYGSGSGCTGGVGTVGTSGRRGDASHVRGENRSAAESAADVSSTLRIATSSGAAAATGSGSPPPSGRQRVGMNLPEHCGCGDRLGSKRISTILDGEGCDDVARSDGISTTLVVESNPDIPLIGTAPHMI